MILFSTIRLGSVWICVLIHNNSIFFTREKEYKLLLDSTFQLGRTYGALTLLSPPTLDMWTTKCYCEKIVSVSTHRLLKGVANCECSDIQVFKDATIGRWVVKSHALRQGKKTFFLCQCNCGSEPRLVDRSNLVNGLSTGCKKCKHKRSLLNGNSNG